MKAFCFCVDPKKEAQNHCLCSQREEQREQTNRTKEKPIFLTKALDGFI
jgi:hypothetical protein